MITENALQSETRVAGVHDLRVSDGPVQHCATRWKPLPMTSRAARSRSVVGNRKTEFHAHEQAD